MRKSTNQTFDAIMQQRKSDMTVGIKALSSTLRKLSIRPDFNPTSSAIGAVDFAMVALLVAFIVLLNLFTKFFCILELLKSVKSSVGVLIYNSVKPSGILSFKLKHLFGLFFLFFFIEDFCNQIAML